MALIQVLEEHVEDAAGPRSQNGKMNYYEVFQNSNAMLFLISTFVFRAENQGVCCGSDLESRTELRNFSPIPIQSTDWILKRPLREFSRQWTLIVKG